MYLRPHDVHIVLFNFEGQERRTISFASNVHPSMIQQLIDTAEELCLDYVRAGEATNYNVVAYPVKQQQLERHHGI